MQVNASTLPPHLRQYFQPVRRGCNTCFVCHLVTIFRAVRRVLHDTGTVFCNLGDSYSGSGKGPTGHNGIGDQGQRQGFVDQRSDVPGLGPKQLMMMPARVALALQADGWVVRSDIIWSKPNPMPESVVDRPTKAHEYLFLLAKRTDYYFDQEAIREPVTGHRDNTQAIHYPGNTFAVPGTNHFDGHAWHINPAGRNRRSVWTIPTESYEGAHFATFPRKLVEPCILAGTSARGQCPACGAPWRRKTRERNGRGSYHDHGADQEQGMSQPQPNSLRGADFYANWEPPQTTGWQQSCTCPPHDPAPQTVLDPFLGSGTTAYVARHHGRRAVGIELNASYARLAADRLKQGTLGLEVW